MGIGKAASHLRRDLLGYGPFKGLQVLQMKKGRGGQPRSISVRRLGGRVWVRPGTSDLAILDQIALEPYMPIDADDPPGVIVDLGANIGLSSRFFASAYPNAHIIAVEPDPGNFNLLEMNTNGFSRIQRLLAGVWPIDGYVNVEVNGLGNSGFRTRMADNGTGRTEAISIPTLMTRYAVDRISLLKVDIEGAEMDLFTGGDLSWIDKVDKIAIEIHDHIRPGACQAFFAALHQYQWNVQLYHGVLMCRRAIRR